jgi:hypothetical protein
MALIVEDGTGLSTAESYISVADATTYFTSYKSATDLATWTGSSTAVQELALRRGAQYMLSCYRTRWLGDRMSGTQALDWPRASALVDGYYVDSTAVPTEIKRAQCELAFAALTGELQSNVTAGDANIASESNSVGSLSQSATYLGGKTTQVRYTLADRLLAAYLFFSSDVVRG